MANETLIAPAVEPFPPLTAEQAAWVEKRRDEVNAALQEAYADRDDGRVDEGSLLELVAHLVAHQAAE